MTTLLNREKERYVNIEIDRGKERERRCRETRRRNREGRTSRRRVEKEEDLERGEKRN